MSGSRSGGGMGVVPNDRQPYAAVQSESGETPSQASYYGTSVGSSPPSSGSQ
jgi:hypothetical protein